MASEEIQRSADGRFKRQEYCKRGHPLEGRNLYVLPRGGRHCKACRLWRKRESCKGSPRMGSPEWRAKVKAGRALHPPDQKKRLQTMIERYGRPGPPTWNKGKHLPEWVRAKLSESAKRRWQREGPEITKAQLAGKRNDPTYALRASIAHKKSWLNPEVRAKILAGIARMPKSQTSIEVLLQEELNKRGIPFIVGAPVAGILTDLLLTDERVVIFADGCYWHGCMLHKPNGKKHRIKIDEIQTNRLRLFGWSVYRFWEHDIRASPASCIDKIDEIKPKVEVSL